MSTPSTVRLFQVDAFTSQAFSGNPAAVCLLDAPAEPTWMQAVALEMNLSETAFVEPGDPRPLRWFTPTTEAELCGHATLATAHVLWSECGVREGEPLRFATRSGTLSATAEDGWIEVDLPAQEPVPAPLPSDVIRALRVAPVETATGTYDLVEVATPAEVKEARPDMAVLEASGRAYVVTARARDGVVCRVFAPAFGIPEDPATGAAQCVLGPWWSGRLGTDDLVVHQLSRRCGTLRVRTGAGRVRVAGQAVTTLRGSLSG